MFAFVVPEDVVVRWHMMLPPRRTKAPSTDVPSAPVAPPLAGAA